MINILLYPTSGVITMTKEELLQQKTDLEAAIKNVLEAGEEFQTRNGRVKQSSLSSLRAQLSAVESQLSMYDKSMATTELYVYGGCR